MTDLPEGHAAHLYVIGEGNDSTIVKIGRSSDPLIRLSGVQVGNPKKMQLLLVVPEAGVHEVALHRKFSTGKLGGEWFRLPEGDPADTVLRALDEILNPPPKPKSAVVRQKMPMPTGPPRRNVCKESSCDTVYTSAMDAAVRWFLDNHPDPAMYLMEQGIAWHCIEETFRDDMPEESRQRMLSQFDPQAKPAA